MKFDNIPDTLWEDARTACTEWLSTGGDTKRWHWRIARCQTKHFDLRLSWKDVREAFEMERDEMYASMPHEDDAEFTRERCNV